MGIVQQIPRRDDRSEIRDSAWPASMCVCSTASEHPAQGLGVMGLGFKGVGLYSDQPGVDLNRLNPPHCNPCLILSLRPISFENGLGFGVREFGVSCCLTWGRFG